MEGLISYYNLVDRDDIIGALSCTSDTYKIPKDEVITAIWDMIRIESQEELFGLPEMTVELLLKLPREELRNMCSTSKKIRTICLKPSFVMKYNSIWSSLPGKFYKTPQSNTVAYNEGMIIGKRIDPETKEIIYIIDFISNNRYIIIIRGNDVYIDVEDEEYMSLTYPLKDVEEMENIRQTHPKIYDILVKDASIYLIFDIKQALSLSNFSPPKSPQVFGYVWDDRDKWVYRSAKTISRRSIDDIWHSTLYLNGSKKEKTDLLYPEDEDSWPF